VLSETIYCAILGALVGYFGGAGQPDTLGESVVNMAKLGALVGAGIGLAVGFVLKLRDGSGLVGALRAALLGGLFATVFVALLAAGAGVVVFYTGGWQSHEPRGALFGALGGAVFGVAYGFVAHRLLRGGSGKT
jgi:hypothetical protein